MMQILKEGIKKVKRIGSGDARTLMLTKQTHQEVGRPLPAPPEENEETV